MGIFFMLKSKLKTELPKFKDRLFRTKQEALDSGLLGTVYIGSHAIHSVSTISIHVNKKTSERSRIITYIWTRTFWDESTESEYSYVVSNYSEGGSLQLNGSFISLEKAFAAATNIHNDSVNIDKYNSDGECVAHYGWNWNQKPDFERCLKELGDTVHEEEEY